MNQFDDFVQDIGVTGRIDTVAEIEDMADMGSVVGKNSVGSRKSRLATGKNEGRIEIALDDEVRPHTTTGITNGGAPIQSEHMGSSSTHRLEQMVTSDPEVDSGYVRMESREFSEHVRAEGQDVSVVVGSAQRAGPGVEKLKGSGTSSDLGVDEGDRVLGESFHDLRPKVAIAGDHRLGERIVLGRSTFDQVTRNGEGGSGKRQQRDLRREFSNKESHRLDDVGNVGVWF